MNTPVTYAKQVKQSPQSSQGSYWTLAHSGAQRLHPTALQRNPGHIRSAVTEAKLTSQGKKRWATKGGRWIKN